MENQKFGTLDIELIDLDELSKLDKEDVKAMRKEVEGLQWEDEKEGGQ